MTLKKIFITSWFFCCWEFKLTVDVVRDGEQILLEGVSSEELTGILSQHYTFVEKKIMRCPHTPTALKMMLLIQKVKEQKDSIGGILKKRGFSPS